MMEKAMTTYWGGPVQSVHRCIPGWIGSLELAPFSDVHLKHLEILQHSANPKRREKELGLGETTDCSLAAVRL